MGKAIIIPDVSFQSFNLGRVTFVNNIGGLKITALENLTLLFSNDFKYTTKSYPDWINYKANTEIHIVSGNSITIKGSLSPTEADGIGTFVVSGQFNISGNISALINNNISDYTFKHLFLNCTGLINASELILPEDTAESCYEGMFKGCTSLTVGPDLKATTLTADCYKELFYGCSSLNTISIYSETPLSETYSLNWVNGVAATGVFNKIPYITYENGNNGIPNGWDVNIFKNFEYFTVESLADNNTISIQNVNMLNRTVSYSLDNAQTWSEITVTRGNTVNIATVNENEVILLKGVTGLFGSTYQSYNKIISSDNFKVYGNSMSLLYGDDFIDKISFAENSIGQLAGLFYGTTTLTDASGLLLPALECKENSYNCMFRGCTNLVHGPQILPATVAGQDCYGSMFEGCINLIEAPEIMLETLAQTCCTRMFCMDRNNKLNTPKMTASPILRAKIGVENCYLDMFKGNGNITEVTCLMVDNFQCSNWLLNCSNTGTFKKDPNADWPSGNSGVPNEWSTVNYVEN